MFNSQKPVNKENTLDSDFAQTIRQICLRKNVSVEKFINGMDQPYDIAKKMFYGKHPWMGYTTFRELERLTGTTPGYIEELYRNIKERSA